MIMEKTMSKKLEIRITPISIMNSIEIEYLDGVLKATEYDADKEIIHTATRRTNNEER